VLAFLALVSGVWFEHTLPEFLSPVLGPSNLIATDSIIASILHSWVGIAGMVLAILFYTVWTKLPAQIAQLLFPLTKLSENKFYVDEIYDFLIVKPLASFSRFLWISVDQGAVDFTVGMTAKSVDASGFIVSRLQSGQLRTYAIVMFVGALLLLTFYIVL